MRRRVGTKELPDNVAISTGKGRNGWINIPNGVQAIFHGDWHFDTPIHGVLKCERAITITPIGSNSIRLILTIADAKKLDLHLRESIRLAEGA